MTMKKSTSEKNYQEENRLLKMLGTRQGFFQYYFEELPKHKTNMEAFTSANEKFFELFDEYRYESYNSFRGQLNSYHKNRK